MIPVSESPNLFTNNSIMSSSYSDDLLAKLTRCVTAAFLKNTTVSCRTSFKIYPINYNLKYFQVFIIASF